MFRRFTVGFLSQWCSIIKEIIQPELHLPIISDGPGDVPKVARLSDRPGVLNCGVSHFSSKHQPSRTLANASSIPFPRPQLLLPFYPSGFWNRTPLHHQHLFPQCLGSRPTSAQTANPDGQMDRALAGDHGGDHV